MRRFLAWLVGIAVFVGIGVALLRLGSALGVASSIELDGPTTMTVGSGRFSYDEEVSSLQTSFGYASSALAFVIALWAGQAAYFGAWRANFSRARLLSFVAWSFALVAILSVLVLTDLLFRSAHGSLVGYLRAALEFGAMFAIGWVGHRWYKKRSVLAEHERVP